MPRVNRTAEVVWTGDSRHGQGHISTESGALKDAPYSWPARFQDAAGTNPEELMKKTKKRDGFILRVKRKSHPRP